MKSESRNSKRECFGDECRLGFKFLKIETEFGREEYFQSVKRIECIPRILVFNVQTGLLSQVYSVRKSSNISVILINILKIDYGL